MAHAPKRRGYGSHGGGTTPAPGDLADRDFTAGRPNEKWLTDITEIKAGNEKGVPLADDRPPRRQDSRPHSRIRPRRAARRHHAGEGGRHVARGRASSGAF